jgi:hypothetical protein
MNTENPEAAHAVHAHLARAMQAGQEAEAALAKVGTLAVPEHETEARAWRLLNANLQSVMLLLAIVSERARHHAFDASSEIGGDHERLERLQ